MWRDSSIVKDVTLVFVCLLTMLALCGVQGCVAKVCAGFLWRWFVTRGPHFRVEVCFAVTATLLARMLGKAKGGMALALALWLALL